MKQSPLLDVLMITYNRAEYTARTLSRLLETIDERVRVWVWHNGTDQATLDVVKAQRNHPCFHHLETSAENLRLRRPTNWFWNQADAPYLSKLDDDCLLTPGWLDKLLDSHERNPKLGIIGCWRYYDDDYCPEIANRKIRQLDGGHQILLNAWIEGTGYVMKRSLQRSLGEIRFNESFYGYCIRAALQGWQVGWHYPFIHQEHMDDPRSPFFGIKTEEDFLLKKPLSAINNNVKNLAEWKARVRHMAYVVQAASPNPRHYSGWRRMARHGYKRIQKFLRLKEPWQQS